MRFFACINEHNIFYRLIILSSDCVSHSVDVLHYSVLVNCCTVSVISHLHDEIRNPLPVTGMCIYHSYKLKGRLVRAVLYIFNVVYLYAPCVLKISCLYLSEEL